MSLTLIIFIGVTIATIGALSFGLVNVMVLDTAYNKGKVFALNIAHGAAWVRVLFGLTAILVGKTIHQFAIENQFTNYFFLLFPGILGLIFLFSTGNKNHNNQNKSNVFFKGILYNLISIQVLLYWIITITFLGDYQLIIEKRMDILMILTGIWIGKMTLLWFYALMGQKIFSRLHFLSLNINRVIGSILLLTILFNF